MKAKISALIATLLFIAATHADIEFQDHEFNDSDWEVIVLPYGNGGTLTSAQACPGGNAGCFRHVTIQANDAPSGGRSGMVGFHRRIGSDYNPASQGAITSIEYSQDTKLIFNGMALGLALRQAGELYMWYWAQPVESWTTQRQSSLHATNFVHIDLGQQPSYLDYTRHPDFSSTATPIEFGFIAAGSTGLGADATSGIAGIDNWFVSVRTRTHLTIRCSEVELCWNSRSNQMYQLQYHSDLTTNQWTDLGAPIEGNGSTYCVRDPIATHERRFYRAIELP